MMQLPEVIELSKGQWTIVDEDDLELILRASARWHAHRRGRHFYAAAGHGGRLSLHRVLTGARDGELVDHINGDTLDNRRCNLRLVTPSQNAQNMSPREGCSSQYKGVAWDESHGKWHALITHDGERLHLGFFDDETEAARCYDSEAVLRFGEYARPNFVKGN
jgi:hypothetical protein